MDDALAELNRMAENAQALATEEQQEPCEEDIIRWVTIFHYSRPEAKHLLTQHRADITREHIPDSHWDIIRSTLEPQGHNRESYEHSLTLKDVLQSNSTIVYDIEGNKWWVFRLGGMLGTREKVMEVAGLTVLPKTTRGVSEDTGGREVEFVWVDEKAKGRIDVWIDEQMVLVGR